MTKYNQITDEDKDNLYKWNSDSFSDLSFWIVYGLDGCQSDSMKFTGLKATRATWDKLVKRSKKDLLCGEWMQKWIVIELLRTPSKRSGLSYKDRERLYILLRKATVNHLTKELNELNVSKGKEKKIKTFIARFDKIGLSAALKGSDSKLVNRFINSSLTFLEDDNWDSEVIIYKMTETLESFEDICVVPNGTKVVSFVRKAMKNVGLRPDATKEPKWRRNINQGLGPT